MSVSWLPLLHGFGSRLGRQSVTGVAVRAGCVVICFDMCNAAVEGQQQSTDHEKANGLIAEAVHEWAQEFGIGFGGNDVDTPLSVQQVGCATCTYVSPQGALQCSEEAPRRALHTPACCKVILSFPYMAIALRARNQVGAGRAKWGMTTLPAVACMGVHICECMNEQKRVQVVQVRQRPCLSPKANFPSAHRHMAARLLRNAPWSLAALSPS